MKTLKEFYNKNVEIIAANGKRFSGKVIDYVFPEYNENEKESIIIDDNISGDAVEFYMNDIRKINIY